VPWQGFPTIGDVLSQTTLPEGPGPSYDCAWIGKWHVSDYGGTSQPGYNGPSDYGFKNAYCIPGPNQGQYPNSIYYSPNGLPNEGTAGDFLDTPTPGSGAGHANAPQNDPNHTHTHTHLALCAFYY
jgi:hypothetical protein